MDAKAFVDSLFEGYEETAALADFKEELLGNLNAKIENLMKKGMDAERAFAQASAELGDVSALADELSRKKRKEVFEEAYMDIRKYMKPGRVAAYAIFGAIALFGICAAVLAFFSLSGSNLNLQMTSSLGALFLFITTAVAGFVFLGVTQETAALYPISNKRAAWYTVAATLITMGLFSMPLAYFSSKFGMEAAAHYIPEEALDVITRATMDIHFSMDDVPIVAFFGPIIPFVLPGICILAFMLLTEKDRLKPWAKDFRKKAALHDPASAARFGLISGAIGIFTIGLFILLGFLIGFKYSWLVFIFAAALQLLVQGLTSKRGSKAS